MQNKKTKPSTFIYLFIYFFLRNPKKQLPFECSHFRISSTDSKGRIHDSSVYSGKKEVIKIESKCYLPFKER